MWTLLVISLVGFSTLFLLALIVRFIQPEMIYAVRHAIVQVKSTKAFLDYYDNRSTSSSSFPDLLGDDLRFETLDSDEEDVLTRVDKIRELYRVQICKHMVPGVKKPGRPQVCIIELAGMLVNLGRDVKPEERFRYPTIDADLLLKFICDEVRGTMGKSPLKDISHVEEWFTEHPISIEQVIEILISAIFAISYRQRVQVKARQEQEETGGERVEKDNNLPDASGAKVDLPITGFIEHERDAAPTRTSRDQHLSTSARGARLIKVFVSYSHQDEKFLGPRSLLGALKGLESEAVEFWTDRAITVGDKWDDEIKRRISTSHIALILVSQSYLDSPYCQNTEIKMFLQEAEKRGLVIFPIMLSRCEWERHEWLSNRQFLPDGGKNIEEHFTPSGKRWSLFYEIRQHLRAQIEGHRARFPPQDV
jgi:hypothetical protein